MNAPWHIDELRPAEIIWLYWAEVLDMEEGAELLTPQYLEAIA